MIRQETNLLPMTCEGCGLDVLVEKGEEFYAVGSYEDNRFSMKFTICPKCAREKGRSLVKLMPRWVICILTLEEAEIVYSDDDEEWQEDED